MGKGKMRRKNKTNILGQKSSALIKQDERLGSPDESKLSAKSLSHVQLCVTPCMDCGPPGSSVHDSPGKSTGVGCPALLQGIFLTQGSNLGLLHRRQFLYHWAILGSPMSQSWEEIKVSKRKDEGTYRSQRYFPSWMGVLHYSLDLIIRGSRRVPG